MPRRAGGTSGTHTTAIVNAFEIRWDNQRVIHHYDVMTPDWELKDDRPLSRSKGVEIIARLQEKVHPIIFQVPGAFDGRKNLFSTERYQIDAQEFRVPFDNHPNGKKFVKVRMTHVSQIRAELLHPLLQGESDGLLGGNHAIMAVNLFFQKEPQKRSGVFNSNSVFFPQHKRTMRQLAVELWPGLFQSVRPTYNKLFVNVDFATGVILPNMKLEDLILQFLRFKPHDTRRLHTLDTKDILGLKAFLGEVRVAIDLPMHKNKKGLRVRAIIPRVGHQTFDKDGEKVRIVDHFKRAHNHVFDPNSLGVRLGSSSIFPISVCRVIQQLFKHNSNQEIVGEALLFAPRDPRARFEAINASWANLEYTRSPFLLGAGITVEDRPMTVNGRILNPPTIMFNGSQTMPLARPGVWNLMRNQLHTPCTIQDWMVLNLAPEAHQRDVDTFVNGLIQTMSQRHIQILTRPRTEKLNGNAEFISAMRNANVPFILVILPANAEPIYREVKRMGNIKTGIITQCVKWTPERGMSDGRANQYHNNLILKINAKLGGVNFVPQTRAMDLLTDAMVIGADVSHPGVGSAMPSIVAMVSSHDKTVSQYATSVRVQESRTEIIEDIEELTDIALKTYFRRRQGLPKRIVYLRDGVSEGEYAVVRDNEGGKMTAKIAKIYQQMNQPPPSVHIIVVSKRHHIRFMPNLQDPAARASQDPKGNNNLMAGFVVDQDIVHPVYPEFYIQSQPGLKGTSRPTRYVVLTNIAPARVPTLNADQLQEMVYALCYCYSRSTRSVKVPAPVYYADLVCRNAKFHYDDTVGHYDVRSVSDSGRPHLDYFRQHFEQVHSKLQGSMYFV